ncbi:MAG: TIGR02757 family protein [Flavobacteriaceae bacterium]|nr:TIGR02757 family protein [Flavobacteriaceae bacterium]
MDFASLKSYLDEKAAQYNQHFFIASDPIQIPHRFEKKEDIEIAAFLSATIAWGNRKSIIKNANRMMQIMEENPFDFICHHQESDLKAAKKFVHRTFQGVDFCYFLRALQHIYINGDTLENFFVSDAPNLFESIHQFKKHFFSLPHKTRTQKHLPDPIKGSAAKRMHMFLRWMVRRDPNGVDFGIWTKISPAQLSCPLDVHTGNIARKLGLLSRKQNDAKTLLELDTNLRKMDPIDPVKYDFALFGLGAFEHF